MSKKVTLDAAGTAATVADATFGDIFSTVFSTDSAVTGVYGLAQKGLILVAGMAGQEFRRSGSLKFW